MNNARIPGHLAVLVVFLLIGAHLMAGTYSGGSGTSSDPYLISNLNDLQELQNTTSDWDKYFTQTADIDASATSGWDGGNGFSPIGNYDNKFTGSYDGGGHTISGLTISRTNIYYVGMFGFIGNSGTVQNLGLTSVDILGDQQVGGLAGNNSGSISHCYSTGNVNGAYDVGGLVGFNYGSISNSYSTADTYGDHYGVGGLLGKNSTNGSVINCYSRGSTRGDYYVGGLVGDNYGSGTVIDKSFSTGNVSCISSNYSDHYIGGLVGRNVSGTVSNSFWDKETSSMEYSEGGTGKTTSEMKTLATFTDLSTSGLDEAWDFVTNPNDDTGNDDYWDMDNSSAINDGYPYLSWQDGDDQSLPVQLSSFTASVGDNNAIILRWRTESEIDNLGFILERAENDPTSWQMIASYRTNPALRGQGNTSAASQYSFTDANVESDKLYYYRLSSVDFEGQQEICATVYIQFTEPSQLPGGVELEAAYPNPFNPRTCISYQLPQQMQVEVQIFDILGHFVKTLFKGEQAAGNYRLFWDATNAQGQKVPTGSYVIRLHTPNSTQVQKITFLK